MKGEFAKIFEENSELANHFGNKGSFSVWMGCHVEELPPAYSIEDIIVLRKKKRSEHRTSTCWTATVLKLIDEHIKAHEIQQGRSPPFHLMLKSSAAVDALDALRKDFEGMFLNGNKSKAN